MCISVMYIHRSGIVAEEHNVSEAFILFTFPPALCVLVIQSCPTPCNPWTTGSLPGSSACGILQARILKWFAIPFSSGPHSVGSLHHDLPILGCPTGMA